MMEDASKTDDKRLFEIFGLMRPEEIAEVFGVGVHAVRKWIGARVVPVIKFRGTHYIDVESFKKHLKDLGVKPHGNYEGWKAVEGRAMARRRKDRDEAL